MNSTDIFVKTAGGAEEVKSRSRKLAQRLRTMLIMIDGSLTVGQLREAAATLGAPADFLDVLQREGLIASVPIASAGPVVVMQESASEFDRFQAAQKFMNDTAVDALGLRAFFFTLKLEKCFNRADLSALLPDYTKIIAKGSGDKAARLLETQVRDKLR